MKSVVPGPLALDIRALFLNSIFDNRAGYAHSILHIASFASLAVWRHGIPNSLFGYHSHNPLRGS